MDKLFEMFDIPFIQQQLLPASHAQDITTVFHVQKRIGKEFDDTCAKKIFKAIANGQYSTRCELDAIDIETLKNLKYQTYKLWEDRDHYEVGWEPQEYHKIEK